jgi:hypothetical protein
MSVPTLGSGERTATGEMNRIGPSGKQLARETTGWIARQPGDFGLLIL